MFCDALSGCSPVPLQYITATPNLRDDDSFGARTVKNYELEYVEKGTGYVIVDGKDIPCTAHALHFRRPGMVVEGIGIYHSHYIEFLLNGSAEVVEDLNVMPEVYFLNEWTDPRNIFMSIFSDYYTDEATRILTFKIHVLRLFELMVREWYHQTAYAHLNTVTTENINRSQDYIHRNYALPLSVQLLAEHAGYSVFHYSHAFKQTTGETPVQYIKRIRLNHARQLLAETEYPTEEVMNRCGFNNYAYFMRSFKQRSGATPGEYRQKHRRIKSKYIKMGDALPVSGR